MVDEFEVADKNGLEPGARLRSASVPAPFRSTPSIAPTPGFGMRRSMILVVLLSFVAPLSIDIVLPASKLIADQFGTGVVGVQGGLTSYLLAFAVASLFHGALADAYGRRDVVLWSLALYAVGAAICASALSVQMLSLGRLLQGCSAGAGVVIGRAIISDLFDGAEAKRRLATISMMLSLPPAVAPILGGWLSHFFGWRSNFVFLGFLAIALACACFSALAETLPSRSRRPLQPKYLMRAYGSIFGDSRFLCLTGAATALLAGQFVFIAGSASILIDHYQLTEVQFWKLFVPITLGVFLGGIAARHLIPRMPEFLYVSVAFGITLCAAFADVVIAGIGVSIRQWTFIPSFIYAFGMLLVLPIMFGTCLAERPEMPGAVAASQVFLQFVTVTLVSGVLIPLTAHSLLQMCGLKIAFTLLGTLLWFVRPE